MVNPSVTVLFTLAFWPSVIHLLCKSFIQIPSSLDQTCDVQDYLEAKLRTANGKSRTTYSEDRRQLICREFSGNDGDCLIQISSSLDQTCELQDNTEAKLKEKSDKPNTIQSDDRRQLSGSESSANAMDSLTQEMSSLAVTSDLQDQSGPKPEKKNGNSQTTKSEDRRQLSCKDRSGKDVDWYYIYNLPMGSNGSRTGNEYYFLSNRALEFKPSTHENNLSTNMNPLAQTLVPIYQQRSEIDVIFYNDQPPPNEGNFPQNGHTKGVVAFYACSGFWLIHSIPRFPSKGGYEWPNSANRNGQSALCVTFSRDTIAKIVQQLQYMVPHVYYPENVSNSSEFFPVVGGTQFDRHENKESLTSSGGQQFTHYAKNKTFGKDLYSEFVAKDLKSKLYVATWRNEPLLPSDCSTKLSVCNVDKVNVGGSHLFQHTKDHSKWAVSENGTYICIGDLNRATSQFTRGGGTMCTNLSVVAEQYLKMITQLQPCLKNETQRCELGNPLAKHHPSEEQRKPINKPKNKEELKKLKK